VVSVPLNVQNQRTIGSGPFRNIKESTVFMKNSTKKFTVCKAIFWMFEVCLRVKVLYENWFSEFFHICWVSGYIPKLITAEYLLQSLNTCATLKSNNVIFQRISTISMACFKEGLSPEEKNGVNQCLGIEYACRRWLTKHTSKRVDLLSFWGRWWGEVVKWGRVHEDGFLKFLCSHHVPNDVPYVLNAYLPLFPKFPFCSSRVLLIAPHFNSYPLPKVLHFSPV
jgi:hypothetical protein